MKVLVCGGRLFNDLEAVFETLEEIHAEREIHMVIHGGATGADELGGLWAQRRMIEVKVFPANWTKHGRAAGPIRNRQMLDEGKPDLVVAFPGSSGTDNMKAQARASGVQVVEVKRRP